MLGLFAAKLEGGAGCFRFVGGAKTSPLNQSMIILRWNS